MKLYTPNNILRTLTILIACCLTFSISHAADGDVSDSESEMMRKSKINAPVWQETDPNPTDAAKTPYLKQRRALVGYNCQINRIISTVAVGTWTSTINNLVNEDLDDTAEFPGVVGATIAATPIVGIRDLDNYYAAATTVGFCIVANGGGTKVISLDVIKSMHIWLYCDGKRVDDLTVREGNTGSGVKLQLFAVGNESACVNLTAVSTKKFDEVVLVQGGGLDAEVGNVIKVKYAFVGDSHDIYLTKNGIKDYCDNRGLPQMNVSCDAYMPTPLVGGIPLPVVQSFRERAIDDDLTNTVPLVSAVQLASIAFKGRVRINVENSDRSISELFEKGSQVGFKFNVVEVVNLIGLGAWIDITLYDHNGNDVQTTTISAEGLALSLASGGDQTSYIVAEEDFSGAEISFYTALNVLDVGSGFGVYYAFVRPKPEIEKHRCEINPSYGVNICDQQSTYQLLSNKQISVRWEKISWPEGSLVEVTTDGYVTNIDKPGDYTFRAYSVTDDCYQDVTIHHGMTGKEVQCEIPLKNESTPAFELSTSPHEISGSLISVSDLENAENIFDGREDTYATYVGELSLIDNLMIVGAKAKDPSNDIFNGNLVAQQPVRVGFVVQSESTGLDLDALNLFNIRCFNDGVETYQHAIVDMAVVGVDLLGEKRNEKIRYLIEVPKFDSNGKGIIFDEFQLWKSGVLGLNIDKIDIYYPFIEEVSTDNSTRGCGNAIMEGSEILNYKDDFAHVSAENIGAIAVGDVVSNLSNIVDYDENLETYATIVKGIGSGQTVISVKMGHVQDYRQQVGVVVDQSQYVNVDLGSVFSVATYLNGEETGEEQTTWNALGVNVIGSDGQAVLLISPTKEYDEIRIKITNGLNVLQTNKIYGIILRNDIDHDGISDYRDDDCCTTTIDNMQNIPPCCLGETIHMEATAPSGTIYHIEMTDQMQDGKYIGVDDADQSGNRITATSTQEGLLTFDLKATKVGYKMPAYIYDDSGNRVGTAYYNVHPLQTTWKQRADDNNWNNWNNWTNGSPYLCTDVIIPSECHLYPLLDEEITDESEYDKYGCDRIFFESHAAVEQVFKLNYTQAWVNINMMPKQWHLISPPLQNMYSGDMFISDDETIKSADGYPFLDLSGSNYPQNRFAPRIYQRLWEKAADVKRKSNEEIETNGAILMPETRWSQRFNALKYDYKIGEGIAIWAESEEDDSPHYVFRFPKAHEEYNYFNEADRSIFADAKETGLTRTAAHRFAYEQGQTPQKYSYKATDDRDIYADMGDLTIRATNESATTRTFLIGNPFMSHIDVKEFLRVNDNVKEIKTYDGNTTTSATAVAGEYVLTTDGSFKTIRPTEAFFAVAKEDGTTLDVKFTAAMFKHGKLIEDEEDEDIAPILGINVKANGNIARSILVEKTGETQTETLFNNEAMPEIAVFTIKDNKALDINTITDEGVIPIGLYLGREENITFEFSSYNGFPLDSYYLLDRLTNKEYQLTELTTVNVSGTCFNRFAICRKSTNDMTDISTVNNNDDIIITIADNRITANSKNKDITRIELFDYDGKIVATKDSAPTNILSLTTDCKIGIINVIREDKSAVKRKFIK